MLIILFVIAFGAIVIYFFMQQPQFGQLPSGARMERILASPNYSEGQFQNQSYTPDLTEGANYFTVTKKFIFEKNKRSSPTDAIPSTKTDLLGLAANENVLVWFGHSSYFMQVDGKRILVDPVFSGNASPLSFTTKAFAGTDRYSPSDMPMIDYLFISHDHWDHLDYSTILELQPKIGKIICALGVGQHFESWGFDLSIIEEHDWDEFFTLEEGFTVNTTPARHFSGRTFSRNQSLWTSFVLQTPTSKIFIGGDSGYDSHFLEIGQKFGPFDLAILENGQYDRHWKYIHMMPEEVVKAAMELQATSILPVHSAKFPLSNHDWDDPLIRVSAAAANTPLRLLTPIIGEKVNLQDTAKVFAKWWEGVE